MKIIKVTRGKKNGFVIQIQSSGSKVISRKYTQYFSYLGNHIKFGKDQRIDIGVTDQVFILNKIK